MASSGLPYALGIHTTTPQLGLCCSHPERGIDTQTWDLGRDMSTQLHEHLFSFIQPNELQQLKFIAVAKGPGGFTSTRLGVVTARTLAQQLNIPLFGISSLAAYVWHTNKGGQQQSSQNLEQELTNNDHGQSSSTIRTAVEMPARRGQVFGAVYDMIGALPTDSNDPVRQQLIPTELVAHKDDHVIDAEVWNHYLNTELPKPWTGLTITDALGHTVSSVLEIATLDYLAQKSSHWSTVHPFYGQSPV